MDLKFGQDLYIHFTYNPIRVALVDTGVFQVFMLCSDQEDTFQRDTLPLHF